jgi:hypothetical protein
VPASQAFGCAEFSAHDTVAIGRSEKWLSFSIGPWQLHLAVSPDRRFPDVDRHVLNPADAVAQCQLSADDAQFLAKAIARLPGDDDYNSPLTLDLNGHVAIRAQAADRPPPTEVILANSFASGVPTRVSTNRQFLARAIRLGFDRLYVYSPKDPVLCQDDHRRFIWAVLDPDSSIPPAENPVRIESPADPAGTIHHPPRRRTKVPKSNHQSEPASQNGQSHADKVKPEQPFGAIEQAVALRDLLRDTTNKATELIRVLQSEKKQARQLRSALASLREFQKLEI